MEAKAVKKVAGGKLVRIEFSYADTISKVKITGDFFLHPENTLEKIEESIVGASIPVSKSELQESIEKAIRSNNAQLIGLSAEDIASTIEEALQ